MQIEIQRLLQLLMLCSDISPAAAPTAGVNSTRSWYLYQTPALGSTRPPHSTRRQQGPFVTIELLQTSGRLQRARPAAMPWQREMSTNAPPANPPPLTGSNAALFIEGCFDAMQSSVSARILVAGAVGISYVVLMDPKFQEAHEKS
uniref:TOM core complex subunit Tom6 n=1 Tax=Macrostomum lignano TaxID=282301 RepID=A0A1I8JNN6_9PLAT